MMKMALFYAAAMLLIVTASALPFDDAKDEDDSLPVDRKQLIKLPLAEDIIKVAKNEADGIPKHSLSKRQTINPFNCVDGIYILAFTSGIIAAGSDTRHIIELRASGYISRGILPDLPSNDYFPLKGDLWKIAISGFNIPDSCINIGEIQGIAITENSNDGWNIDSIVTFLVDVHAGGQTYQLASQDFDVNRWVDGDSLFSHRRFDLTLVI